MARKKKAKTVPEWNLQDTLFKLEQKIEEKYQEVPLNLDEDFASSRISTGSLMLDVVIGGGIPAGTWITLYGMESSGKSTGTYQIVKSAIDSLVPNKDFFDYENSLATPYFANIMHDKLENVVGKKDKNDEWVIKPKVKHYMPEYGEKMFHMVQNKMLLMPDLISKKGEKFLRYSDKLVKILDVPEKSILFKEKGYSYVRDTGPPVKYIVFVDSCPEMLPQALYEDSEKSPMAQQARMFSNLVPVIRPSMRRKGVVMVTINHTRLRPGVQFGSPEYIPCGEHLKLATDIRLRVSSVAIPGGKGKIEEEYNLDGKLERYIYSKYAVKKNKKAPTLGRDCTIRVCIEKDGKPGYGIDPVYDLFEYLRVSKQIRKRGDSVTIDLPGVWQNVKITWDDLKRLVYQPYSKELLKKLLADKETKKNPWSDTKRKDREKLTAILGSSVKASVKAKRLKKLLDIRGRCFSQIQAGNIKYW